MRKVKVFKNITYAQQQKLANDILFKESGLLDRFKFPQPTQEARGKVAPPLRTFRCMGLFHQWGAETIDGITYTVAIVELEDGSVITPWFEEVQFVTSSEEIT